jgi:HPt (histidine-containing phosphotransfer) domain-containing protein
VPQPASSTPVSDNRWIDPIRWNVLGDLDRGAGSVRSEIVQDFVSALDERIEAIAQAAESGDSQALLQTAHQLKGAALNIGATPLARSCETLESPSGGRVAAEAVDALVAAARATREALADA